MDAETNQRLIELQRQLTGILLQIQRQPAALAGPIMSYAVVAIGYTFPIGTVVKLSVGSGAWVTSTSADTGPLVLGIVTATSDNTCTVTTWGLRNATGTVGTVFYIPDAAGIASSTPSVAGWWRVMEVQVSAGMRLVRPDVLAWMPLQVQTCVDGTPTPQEFALFSNA
jgi:hypothetical protein